MTYVNTTAGEMYEKIIRFIETAEMLRFLDEVQELRGWEQVANSLLADTDCDIFITGSNAEAPLRQLATLLPAATWR